MKKKYRVYKMTIDRLLDDFRDGFLIRKTIVDSIQPGDELVLECRYRDLHTEFIQCYMVVVAVEDLGDYWMLYGYRVLYNEYDFEMKVRYSFEINTLCPKNTDL